MSPSPPETYFFRPTPHVPNSPLPVLIYRSALPSDADGCRAFVEANGWDQGGSFKTYTAHHFHSVTHECYAVFKGSSRLLLGRGPLDGDSDDAVEVDLSAGDAIVLPAGVAHCSLSSEGDYTYLGLYPKGSPHWDNNFCKAGSRETQEKAEACRRVPLPNHDPIFGAGGPLVDIWRRVSLAN
ncbi:MAG: hypothetical protein M1832_001710 [Thelocarpon impressellum]|nr:MAG: hypothetical protein M1832_001710 [Thelocarpon impressellum]